MTTALVYFRPALTTSTDLGSSTAAVVYLPLRFTSGIFATGAAAANADALQALKAWLPSARTPVTQSDGMMAPAWYRFFDYLVNHKLGGPDAPTVVDVSASIVSSQNAVTQVINTVAGVSQQVNQNAQVVAAQTEVLVQSAAPGAVQIPPVQLAPPDSSGDSGGGGGGGD